jgi:hypothetical protein
MNPEVESLILLGIIQAAGWPIVNVSEAAQMNGASKVALSNQNSPQTNKP